MSGGSAGGGATGSRPAFASTSAAWRISISGGSAAFAANSSPTMCPAAVAFRMISSLAAYVRRWYIERFDTLRRTVFTRPDSYFQRYAELSDDEATETALQIWKDINERNLVANIEPTRDRADVILRKASDHHVDEVRLRRI